MKSKGDFEKTNSDLNQRPFLGLKSFDEVNKDQFGGRDDEIKQLFDSIDSNSLTVTFGKSGIGKTSLLRAGLLPELRENFFFPIYTRIDYTSQKSCIAQLRESIWKNMKQKDAKVAPIESTLWEFFHNVNMLDGLITPVLIIDQFEEIFTLGENRKDDVAELMVELADLAENRIPLSVQENYKKRGETVPAKFGEQPYRIMFSLREDYLARLEELKQFLPSIMDRRFRLVQMSIEQAIEAAVKPSMGLLDEPVAREIIKKLPGISQDDFDRLDKGLSSESKLKVEPFLLSLLCHRINEYRIIEGHKRITTDFVLKFNVKDVINSFYEDIIKKYNIRVEHAIEDRLLTEGGFRKLQSLEELRSSYNVSIEIIEELVDLRLLRTEIRDGVGYVELIHDVLAPIIKENRDNRKEREREEAHRQAIRIAREKNRKRVISIVSTIGVILLGVLAFAILTWQEKNAIEERDKKFNLSQNLLTLSKDMVEIQSEYEKAALLSSLAYKVYKDSEEQPSSSSKTSKYEEQFYNSMYSAVKKIPFDSDRIQLARISGKIGLEEMQLKGVEYVDSNESYIAMSDGSVRFIDNKIRREYKQAFSLAEHNQNNDNDVFLRRSLPFITSMSAFRTNNQEYLAMVGNTDNVFVVDRNDDYNVINQLTIVNNRLGGKDIKHASNGLLYVKQLRSLLKWDCLNEDSASAWTSRDEKSYFNGQEVQSNKNIKWEDSEFKVERERQIVRDGSGVDDKDTAIELKVIKYENPTYIDSNLDIFKDEIKFHSFSVRGDDLVAIGTLGGIMLLSEDNYKEIRFSELKNRRITAIEIHPTDDFILAGTNKGELFQISLNDVSSIKLIGPKLHSEVIVDIAFNDNLAATASWDGTVGLYRTTSVENGTIPTQSFEAFKTFNAYMAGEHKLSKVANVSFVEEGRFIVAGYFNGNVLKWPTTITSLENLINTRVSGDLSPEEIEMYNLLDEEIDIKDYLNK